MQRQHSQSIRDLKQLSNRAEANLSKLRKLVKSLSCTQQQNSQISRQDIKRSFTQVQDSIKKLSKYSEHLTLYFQQIGKQKEQYKKYFQRAKKDLISVAQKCHKLEQESILCRKQLAKKDGQIKQLKSLLQIDASYIESAEMHNSSEILSISGKEQQMSMNSLSSSSQLNAYSSILIDPLDTVIKKHHSSSELGCETGKQIKQISETSQVFTRSSQQHHITNNSSTDRLLDNLQNLLLELEGATKNKKMKSMDQQTGKQLLILQ